ncbi:MAG: A24 family peptidase [Phycisphaerales bacterium]|nr:A24 family peptidase [Phycisphaerales bacterium]
MSEQAVTCSNANEITEKAYSHWPIRWFATWVALVSISAFVASMLVIFTHARGGFFIPVLAIAVCLLAALFDAWTVRIPNPLTYTAILLGLATSALAVALDHAHLPIALKWLAAPDLTYSLAGFFICAILGLLGTLVGPVGGGDIKLLAALGAMLGILEVGSVLIYGLTVALLYALANLALRGQLDKACRITAIQLLELVYLRRINTPTHTDDSKPLPKNMIPMALPLAIGLIISQVINIQTLLGAK